MINQTAIFSVNRENTSQNLLYCRNLNGATCYLMGYTKGEGIFNTSSIEDRSSFFAAME